jgi:hypothetical protein
MVKRYNRLLVAFYVVSDALLAMWAFMLAYAVRFESGLVAVQKGYPPIEHYLQVLPFVAVLVPLAFQIQGVYRLRRGRSRVDDFFAVLIGSILAVVLGVVSTLYVQAYFASEAARSTGAYQVSQLVWALFLGFTVVFTYGSRETVRELLERRWRAGIGLKRVLIAGAGDLGRLVADRILQHRELGYQVVGFLDDRAGGDHIGYRGLPLLGTLAEVGEVAQRERVDHLYVALALDEHPKLLDLMDTANRECIDVKVVPDLLQVIALRARLEDLDGVPIINVNDVPLQGINSFIKRIIDVGISTVALAVFAIPLAIISVFVKLTSHGPVFYRQERMGLDGKSFTIVKFRSMHNDAERETGPVWAKPSDPRVTWFGRFGTAQADVKRDYVYSGGLQFANGAGFYPGDFWGLGYSHYDTGAGPKERLAEGYYNFGISEKFRLSFHLTHVLEKRPGEETVGYLVPGIRLQASF